MPSPSISPALNNIHEPTFGHLYCPSLPPHQRKAMSNAPRFYQHVVENPCDSITNDDDDDGSPSVSIPHESFANNGSPQNRSRNLLRHHNNNNNKLSASIFRTFSKVTKVSERHCFISSRSFRSINNNHESIFDNHETFGMPPYDTTRFVRSGLSAHRTPKVKPDQSAPHL